MPKLRNGSKGDWNPGSLDCESDILPLNHRAPNTEQESEIRLMSPVLDKDRSRAGSNGIDIEVS